MSEFDNEINVVQIEVDGPVIATAEQTSDLIGNAWMAQAQVIAVPVARLDAEFFRLRSGMAGEITQKIVNYRLTLAVIGDISEQVAASDALRDWVWESNRGEHIWFLPDAAALEAKLAPRREAARRGGLAAE